MEDVIDGIKSYIFPTRFDAKLVIIETAKGIVIPRLRQIDTADITSRQYPALEILPETTRPDYRGEGITDYDAWAHHGVILLFSVTGTDPKLVEYTLMRYYKALVGVVKGDNTFGGLFNRVRMGDTQYWPMMTSQQRGELLQVLRQLMYVKVFQ